MTSGWYWYRAHNKIDPFWMAGEWTIVFVNGENVYAHDEALLSDLRGDWRGPLQPPTDDLTEQNPADGTHGR